MSINWKADVIVILVVIKEELIGLLLLKLAI